MRNATLRPPAARAARKDDYDERDVQTMAAPRRGRWALWLAALVVFGLFGGVVWYAYVEGLAGLGGEPPLIRAEAGPYKHVPNDRGGLDVANQSASVIDVFRPPPETPRAEALPPAPEPAPSVDPTASEPRLEAAPDAPDPASLPPVRAEPPPPPPPAPEPVQTATPAPEPLPIPPAARAEPAPAAEPSAPPVAAAEPPPPPPEPVPAPEEEPAAIGSGGRIPVPKPSILAAVPEEETAPPERPAPPAALEARDEPPPPPPPRRAARAEPPPRPVTATPPARPRPERQPVAAQRRPVEPPPPPPRRTQPSTNRQTAAIEPAVPTAPIVPPSPPRSSAYRLQLLALRSEGAMTQAWSQLRQRYPTVLSDLSPSVERIATVSGTMYRLQAGPFASREAATDACSAIQQQGGQCFVVGSTE